MVIDNLYIVGIAAFPNETDSPLIINPNAPLAVSVTGKFFETIGRRNAQIVERKGAAEHSQLSQGHLLNVTRQFARATQLINALCFPASERTDHPYQYIALSVKRQTL
jgi:hypothetical protein